MLVNSRHCLYANTHSGFTYQGLLCKYQRKLVLAPCLMSHSVTTVTIRLFTFLATHCNSASAIPSRCQTRQDMEWLHHALGSLRVCTRGHLIGYQRFREHWFHSGPLLVVQTACPISKRMPSDPTGYTLCLEYHPQLKSLPEDWISEL